jgi:hypothetical protein
MIRPVWSPDGEQRKLLDAAIDATKEADEKVEAGWAAILDARKAGVPDTVICERTGWSRATLNRKYGKRPDATDG